jgi:hypothetical protein
MSSHRLGSSLTTLKLCILKKGMAAIVLLFSVISTHYTYGQSITLTDVLAATVEKENKKNRQHLASKQTLSWLVSSPTIGISHLKTDLERGNDESEVSLNFMMKSSGQKALDIQLNNASLESQKLFINHKKLLLSGLIREQVWELKLAEFEVNNLSKKLGFLDRLENQYQQLFTSSVSTKYSLLLIRKEKITSEIKKLEYRQRAKQVLNQYQQLTGLRILPININENNDFLKNESLTIDKLILAHPQIKQLKQQWLEHKLRMKLATNTNAPWQLSLSAKQLSNPVFDETQLGVSAEIPLTFINIKNQALNSEWLTARNNYDSTKQTLFFSLKNQFQALQSQQQTLSQKQALLEEGQSISQAIIKETQLLIDADQIDQEQAIRRMLTAFSSQYQLTLNQLLLFKNTAMLRQAAGISL